MSQDLHDLADSVESEQDLPNFIEALKLDRNDEEEKVSPSSPYDSGANGWENGNLVPFLGAAVAWGQASIDELEFYKKTDNPWKRVAQILHAGKFYE